jgi:hypothetical protein
LLSAATATLNPATGVLSVAVTQPSQQITFEVDSLKKTMLDVSDGATRIGQFPIASIIKTNVTLTSLDAVTANYSNGDPFQSDTGVFLTGSGLNNSLTVTGSTTISGQVGFDGGIGSQSGQLSVEGTSYAVSTTIASVTDSLRATGGLDVAAVGGNVVLSGTNGVTQTLTGLNPTSGGAGNSIKYSNQSSVELDLGSGLNGATGSGTVTLNATAAAAGEKAFEVQMLSSSDVVTINATPSTVATKVVVNSDLAPANFDQVNLFANAGAVTIDGNSSTNVMLGHGSGSTFVTSGIKANVTVNDVKTLIIADFNNTTTQEKVKVTNSTISGTGLFGSSLVQLKYSDVVAGLDINTGTLASGLAESYTIEGSNFTTPIDIIDDAKVGLTVQADLTATSHLNLNVQNGEGEAVGTATINVQAPGATFNLQQNSAGGSDTVSFGAASTNSTIQFEADPGIVVVHNSNA